MPKTILCIDDDPVYIDLYSTILVPRGYRVEAAFDGAEGLAVAQRLRPALITLDVMLPEKKGFLDGFGLLKEFRMMDDLKEIPIVMVSALGGEDDVKHGLSLGASVFIPKQELTPRLFLRKITELLGDNVEK